MCSRIILHVKITYDVTYPREPGLQCANASHTRHLPVLTALRALGEIIGFRDYFLIRWFLKLHLITVWKAYNTVKTQFLGLFLSY